MTPQQIIVFLSSDLWLSFLIGALLVGAGVWMSHGNRDDRRMSGFEHPLSMIGVVIIIVVIYIGSQ